MAAQCKPQIHPISNPSVARHDTRIAIGLITVSDVILTGRQSGQKLQCLYGNPMAKNVFQNRILHNL